MPSIHQTTRAQRQRLVEPSSNPEGNIAAAKHRARTALHTRNPKLTALEKGFYDLYQSERRSA